MCYSITRNISQAEHLQHLESGNKHAFLDGERAVYKGFDHNNCLVERSAGSKGATERVPMQWGFLPPYITSNDAAKKFRFGYKDDRGQYHKGFTTLNATSEELLNKMYKDAALKRRCLVPVHGFYEWMHVMVVGKSGKLLKTPEKFPYLVKMRSQPEFFLAGVWQPWFNAELKTTQNTFAIVTTAANTLMKQIHNSRERMPTILPGHLAHTWLHSTLSEQEIVDLANYQVASAEMMATPLHKDFLKRANPHEEIVYTDAPPLVYS